MMNPEERKRLIAKGKDNAKIAEAIMEEKRILASKPVHHMQPDPRLKTMKKADAVKLLNEKREKMARGVALMAGAPEKTAPVEVPKIKAKKKKK